MTQFRCTYVIRDGVLGGSDMSFEGDTPYDILHAMHGTQKVLQSAGDKIRLRITHIESGETKTFGADLWARDEDDFSCPVFLNETAVDAWLAALGIVIPE